jgi:hypothetical protein
MEVSEQLHASTAQLCGRLLGPRAGLDAVVTERNVPSPAGNRIPSPVTLQVYSFSCQNLYLFIYLIIYLSVLRSQLK